jgi:hypothetical protein
MTAAGRLFLRLARWIAGSERAEWIDAMEAEAESIRGDSTVWTVGCAAAAFRERLWRERWFLGAVLGLPVIEILLRLLLFFPVVDAGNALGLPAWTFIAVFIALGFPFGFSLGHFMPRRRAVLAALFCGVLIELFGVVEFWIAFGKGPEIWFQPNSHIYNMTPVLGWATGIGIWLVGALAGTFTRPQTGGGPRIAD